MTDFDTLLIDFNKKLMEDIKHNNNFFLKEDEDDDVGMDSLEDLSVGHSNDPAHPEDETDSKSDETTDDNPPESLDGGDDSSNPSDGDTDGSDDQGDDGSGGLDSEQDTSPTDNDKKLQLYKSYKSIYTSIDTFLDKVSSYKEYLDTEENKSKNYELVEYIEDKLYNLKDSTKIMLTDKIKTMDYEKVKTVFVYTKSEINLLVNLFNKFSSSK
ncbi:hypothetical protein INTERNEXUS_299 [Bacillus phage vB_BspM_Internexus]|nr:hypothetical protein INTERNEXUS_299 [Bacillus phage vB_BspM_Internexus]